MRKSQWIITLLLIIGFFLIQQRTVPNVALPPEATSHGTQVTIPFAMKPPNSVKETWVLSTNTSQQYFVSVFVNERMVRRFQANKVTSRDASGTNYACSGQIKFDGQPYQATMIHLGSNQTAGSITFQSTAGSSANQPGNQPGNPQTTNTAS